MFEIVNGPKAIKVTLFLKFRSVKFIILFGGARMKFHTSMLGTFFIHLGTKYANFQEKYSRRFLAKSF